MNKITKGNFSVTYDLKSKSYLIIYTDNGKYEAILISNEQFEELKK